MFYQTRPCVVAFARYIFTRLYAVKLAANEPYQMHKTNWPQGFTNMFC